MNNKTRKQLGGLASQLAAIREKARKVDFNTRESEEEMHKLGGDIGDIKGEVGSFRDEEQDKFDNLSEGLQQSERGQVIEEAVAELDSALSELEDAVTWFEDWQEKTYHEEEKDNTAFENILGQIEEAERIMESL